MYECPCGEALLECIGIVPIVQIIQEYVHDLDREKYKQSFGNIHLFIGFIHFKGEPKEFKSKSQSHCYDFVYATNKYWNAPFASLALCRNWIHGASEYILTAHWGNSSSNHQYNIDVDWDKTSGIAKYANVLCLTKKGRRGVLPKKRRDKLKIPVLLHKAAECLNSMIYESRTARGLWENIHDIQPTPLTGGLLTGSLRPLIQ